MRRKSNSSAGKQRHVSRWWCFCCVCLTVTESETRLKMSHVQFTARRRSHALNTVIACRLNPYTCTHFSSDREDEQYLRSWPDASLLRHQMVLKFAMWCISNVQKDQNRAFLCVSCLIMSCRFNLVPRDSWMNWKHQHVYAFIQWIPIYISTYINAGVVSWHQQVTGVQLVFMDCGRFAHSEARGHHHVLSIQQDKQ